MAITTIHPLYQNERGAALVISLMFLVILGLLGTTAVVMTTTDIKIGTNYRQSQSASLMPMAVSIFARIENDPRMEQPVANGTTNVPFPLQPVQQTPRISHLHHARRILTFTLSNIEMISRFPILILSQARRPVQNSNAPGPNTEIDVQFKRDSAINFAAFGDGKLDMKTVER